VRSELIQTIEAYNVSASNYKETIAKLDNYEQTYEYFSECLKENEFVLDLACGPANVSQYLSRRKRLKITGLDLSPQMVQIAKQIIPEGTFVCSNIVEYESETKYDAAIIGFAIPYLNRSETETLIKNTSLNLKDNGYIYLSFMEGNKEGFEKPSFNPGVEVYIYYHMKKSIELVLEKYGFRMQKQWQLDYKESDGSITTDIVIIAQKT